MKQKVLFVCTQNSARSQMAEGLMNALLGDRYEAHSAGSDPFRVNPFATKAMAEAGIDISHHRSKGVDEFKDWEFDYVVTVCNRAKESCPFFPSARQRIHKEFNDPAALKSTDDEIFKTFCRVRDEIKEWILETFKQEITC